MLQLSSPRTWGVVTYPAGATFGPRAMDDWEWVWIINGHARYRRDDGSGHDYRWFDAPPGSLLLCAPGATDFFEWDTARRTRHAFCHFSIQNLPANWPAPDDWPVVRWLPDDDILRPLLRHLLNWAGRGDSEITRLTLAQMLTCWVREEIDAAPLPRDDWPEAVALARKYLQERLDADSAAAIALDELARAAFVSPEHLCRLFHSATGRSPIQTVRLARLDRALILLSRSNYSVAQIAHLNGFASPFHFSRRFKDAFGCSPQQLRTQLQNGATPPTPRLLQVLARGENIKNGHNLVNEEAIENARETR